MNDLRAQLVSYLATHVVGPFGGSNEILNEPPYRRYLMGTLYAENATSEEVLINEVDEAVGGSHSDEIADDPVTLANSWMPSSLGLSFYISGPPSLSCSVWGGRYESGRAQRKEIFRRIPIADRESPQVVTLERPLATMVGHVRTSLDVLESRARLEAFWRRVGDGYLVTVTLRNIQRQQETVLVDPELCIHQVGFACIPTAGVILEYPSVEFLSRDPEEAELRLLHRHAKVFAIGHGCAADWTPGNTGFTASTVRTELMPCFEVPALMAGGADAEILKLSRLADPRIQVNLLKAELNEFLDHYEEWIAKLEHQHSDIPDTLQGSKTGLLTRLRTTLGQMRRGVEILTNDSVALRAFRLANLAMLMQMRHTKEDFAGKRRGRSPSNLPTVDYLRLDYKWYPFQLAFQLLTLPSVIRPDDEERDVVDLLWFPAGGGKTEAYLAIAALQIFVRRLRSGDAGAGTTVITRYTLRLLTAQQFQRAASLVCAAELLRRESVTEMGVTPISIGLWVGEGVTPNKFTKAAEKLTDIYEAPFPTNPFQLEQCPWCGTALVPESRDEDQTAYGIRATQSSFEFFCPSARCPFHERLPVAVVDEELYQRPPTFLLATVDKFARLAWEERGGAFFGSHGHQPPSLIIQDEMHLLSGPIGTTMGVYESAVEALMTYNNARPKVIASTATIRRAGEQVRGLFGREVRVFPPAGLTASDSYFARTDTSRAGRLYVGLMSQSHTPHTTIVHTAAVLLQAPLELCLDRVSPDAYWTLVAYHNSLRELGRTITLSRDDIPARTKVIASDESRLRNLGDDDIVELTSNVSGSDLPAILERLKRKASDPGSVSVLATTNMLSVGVDISRLTLMLMNGQPKTTSEYIQASSRVGRAEVPGLVVALYVSTKPRDRSHYEGFIPYHSALYRHIEPTSVTPFSLPSRERALHAALVVLVRHGVGLSGNDDASRFKLDAPGVARAVAVLEARIAAVDPHEAPAASAQLRRLALEWQLLAEETRGLGRKLYYQAGKPHAALLKNFGAEGKGWATLHSMRSVDRQCTVSVVGEGK